MPPDPPEKIARSILEIFHASSHSKCSPLVLGDWDDSEHAPINLSPQFALNLAISREEMIARGVLIGSSAAPLVSTLRRQPVARTSGFRTTPKPALPLEGGLNTFLYSYSIVHNTFSSP
ncbi:hypothetical protein B0H16DRAFT_1742563 [Mycena metata]|uniref:Uncharacterized protein n=1 Tax=Mycena metata TaxID=1033252 RepID=A0AAD7H8G0_9AGAR|nr:hypothetical protein B0H16DRAFT_1742563 [Mycena metata]